MSVASSILRALTTHPPVEGHITSAVDKSVVEGASGNLSESCAEVGLGRPKNRLTSLRGLVDGRADSQMAVR